MRRTASAAFACLILLCADVAAQSVPASDDAAIRELVRKYADAREAQDPAAVAALFVSDADQLVSSGEWRRGRDVLVKGALGSSARTPGTRTLDVEAIRMVGADSAIADARYEIRGLEGGASRKMWSTFVVVRQGGAWCISAIRNMLPAPLDDARGRPTDAGPLDDARGRPSKDDRTAVLAVVDDAMRAISASDGAALARLAVPDMPIVSERPAKSGGTEVITRRFDPTTLTGTLRERYWDPTVHVRNGIAVVWAPYEFWVDGKTTHCGIDVFQLVKEGGRWRIGSLTYTVEPTACDALRPTDPSRLRPSN